MNTFLVVTLCASARHLHRSLCFVFMNSIKLLEWESTQTFRFAYIKNNLSLGWATYFWRLSFQPLKLWKFSKFKLEIVCVWMVHQNMWLNSFQQITTCSDLQLSEEGFGPPETKWMHKKLSKVAFSYVVDHFSVFHKILCMHYVTDNFTTQVHCSLITKCDLACVILETNVTLCQKEKLKVITDFWWRQTS